MRRIPRWIDRPYGAARSIATSLGVREPLDRMSLFINRRAARRLVREYDRHSTAYGLNDSPRELRLTVSLTTFPARIDTAAAAVDRLLRQTLRPDRVVLYLGSDEFESTSQLPVEFANLRKRGLTIKLVENLKPHKKYAFAFEDYPADVIVTVDDDILYPLDLLETLVDSYKRHPDAVSAVRGNEIRYRDGNVLPCPEWDDRVTASPAPRFDVMAIGFGGVLYPPGALPAEVCDPHTIRSVCLNADDIWLKFAQLEAGVPVVIADSEGFRLIEIPDSQSSALMDDNVARDANSMWVRRCMRHYGWSDTDLIKRVSQEWDTCRHG